VSSNPAHGKVRIVFDLGLLITPLVSLNFSIAVTETILPKISIFSKDVGYFGGLTEITRIPAPHEIQCTRYCQNEQMCVFFSFHAENGCILYQRENSVMKAIDCLKENSFCCSMENVKHAKIWFLRSHDHLSE
jgi:hypothetical protein